MTKNATKAIQKYLKKIGLLEIIFLGLLIGVGVIFLALFLRKSSYLTVTMKVGEDSVAWPKTGLPAWYMESFKSGMVEKDVLGRPHVEILNTFAYPKNRDTRELYLKVRLLVVYSESTNTYTFNSRPVLIGSTLRINAGNTLAEGLITNIEGVNDNSVPKKLKVSAQIFGNDASFPNTTGVFPHVANAIQVGDQIFDSQGEPVVTILEKKVENAQRVIINNMNQVSLSRDPLKKDVTLTLEVNSRKYGNFYYLFNDLRIAIDSPLPLQFPNLSIYPLVTHIEEIE
jgi:hypothetical protein